MWFSFPRLTRPALRALMGSIRGLGPIESQDGPAAVRRALVELAPRRAGLSAAVVTAILATALAGQGLAAGQPPDRPATAMPPVQDAQLPPADLSPVPATAAAPPDFATWLEALRRDALANGISESTVALALTSVEPLPIVLERDRSQAEFTLTLPQYLERRVNRSMVTQAKRKAVEHRRLLSRVRAAHDVPASILVAVWGLESNFGRFAGVRPTVPVLATLAFDARRGDLFRRELFDALRILDRGDIDLAGLQGSWAGAMGQPQFLPSSYLKFAQDFDQDGHRNIWTSMPDVFASIAFYLKSNGWKSGQTWGRRVRVPEALVARLPDVAPLRTEGCRALRGLTHPLPLAKWRALGVRTAEGGALPRAAMEGSLLRADDDAFLVYENYEALLSYNCAHTYALSVALLADRIDGRTSSWPAAKPARPARTRRPAKSQPRPRH